jgi:hypothetical protein
MKYSMRLFVRAAAITLITGVSAGSLAQATNGGASDPAQVARQQELATIKADRSVIVSEIVEQWTSSLTPADPVLNDDGGLAALMGALYSATPEALLAASEAQSYDEVLALVSSQTQGPAVIALEPGALIPEVLGSTGSDLVFTPITPCRIVDTRIATGGWSGKIGPNSGNWFSVNLTDFTAQGGASSCPGMPTTFNPAAVAINLTSTGQTGPGNLRVIACGAGTPLVSLLNYKPGVNLANAAISSSATGTCALGPPAGVGPNDIYVYSGNSASDVVVDLMGYYAAPVATALDCLTTANTTTVVVSGNSFSLDAAACPAGYTSVSVNCRTSTFNSVNYASVGVNTGGSQCQGTNTSGGSITMNVSQQCCRVPGR